MEEMLGIGRADMAFVFSLASITLTIGMSVRRACTGALRRWGC